MTTSRMCTLVTRPISCQLGQASALAIPYCGHCIQVQVAGVGGPVMSGSLTASTTCSGCTAPQEHPHVIDWGHAAQ